MPFTLGDVCCIPNYPKNFDKRKVVKINTLSGRIVFASGILYMAFQWIKVSIVLEPGAFSTGIFLFYMLRKCK